MAQKTKTKIPDAIYIVAAEDKVRQYTSEGQALNQMTKLINLGQRPRMITYTKEAEKVVDYDNGN